jgi:hypothetical protein
LIVISLISRICSYVLNFMLKFQIRFEACGANNVSIKSNWLKRNILFILFVPKATSVNSPLFFLFPPKKIQRVQLIFAVQNCWCNLTKFIGFEVDCRCGFSHFLFMVSYVSWRIYSRTVISQSDWIRSRLARMSLPFALIVFGSRFRFCSCCCKYQQVSLFFHYI